ncbi:flagellar basal body rod protein FlgG [Effusibacillus consociatus]|uniref:Flagellar hook protein FlgE n=1 Tax=Effusibacillus consociatus TaxID=1117041 RepID=A0ABV9Q2S6_9BACL
MLRSMYSGISGMRGFQTKLDVIGNNIANVNTSGFKAGRVMFKDILSQTVGGAAAPVDGSLGGINPKQIGLGSSISSIDTIHTQGSAQTTNVPTDLMVDGEGFFVLMKDDQTYYTRAGNFKLDGNRTLVAPNGMRVQSDAGDIVIPENAQSFTIDNKGGVSYIDETGASQLLATIQTAAFINPGGLLKAGDNLYVQSPNSGEPLVGNPGIEGRGLLMVGVLEMSNVELTNEFTEMIVAQRGFQANSRIITTSDEILQEVVNLKR